MNILLQIHKSSTYMQNILQNILNDSNDTNEEEINNLLIQTYELLNSDKNSNLKLNINYDQYIEYLINLTNDYLKIEYTKENILQYIILADYFQLKIQDDFFVYILNNYVIKINKFYNKLYLYQPFNYYILNEFGKENNINNNTFKYIFKINKNMCNEITTLHSRHIKQYYLDKCINIVNLNISKNWQINNVNRLQKLEKLNISSCYCKNDCNVDQNGISQLKFIKKLDASCNRKIIDVNHLQQLEELNVSGMPDYVYWGLHKLNISGIPQYKKYICGINQNGISQLTSIKILIASDNDKITDVNHLQKIEYLNISGNCCVGQNGMSQLMLIKKLYAYDNDKICDNLKKI